MLRICSVLALLLLSFVRPAVAESPALDVSFNADVFKVAFAFPVFDRAALEASWLHSDEDGELVGLGIFRTGIASPGANPVKAGLGAKIVYGDPDKGGSSGGSIALGGYFRWVFPNYDRIGIGGELYYAPGVLSFNDTDTYDEESLYVSYDIMQDAWVYVGVRHVQMKFEGDPDVTFDTGVHLGVRLSF
ncbi:MAG: YfaZ family outer membrane protein [Chromatiales bacterium]|jgi:hypothetical protein